MLTFMNIIKMTVYLTILGFTFHLSRDFGRLVYRRLRYSILSRRFNIKPNAEKMAYVILIFLCNMYLILNYKVGAMIIQLIGKALSKH